MAYLDSPAIMLLILAHRYISSDRAALMVAGRISDTHLFSAVSILRADETFYAGLDDPFRMVICERNMVALPKGLDCLLSGLSCQSPAFN